MSVLFLAIIDNWSKAFSTANKIKTLRFFSLVRIALNILTKWTRDFDIVNRRSPKTTILHNSIRWLLSNSHSIFVCIFFHKIKWIFRWKIVWFVVCYAHFELEPAIRTVLIFSINANAYRHHFQTKNIEYLITSSSSFSYSCYSCCFIDYISITLTQCDRCKEALKCQNSIFSLWNSRINVDKIRCVWVGAKNKHVGTEKIILFGINYQKERTVCTKMRCTKNSHLPIYQVNMF